ncbi:MAG TPA: hypothetical protein VNU64_11060 [Burkholderiales bacterium]|nr:hypothetical protein [Burkholderiales bacterium]
MKNGIMAILAAVSLAAITGCDSQAEPNASLMLRYQVDAGRDRSWWLTRDGVLLHSAAQPKKFIPLPGWLWAADPHCPPDFTLGPNGEAVVTSNVVPTLWRIDPQTLAVTVHELQLDSDTGRDVGFAALGYSAEQAAFFAYSEHQRSVWRIDRQLARASKVSDVDFSPLRTARTASVRGPCTELGQRLMQFAGIER